MNFRIWIVEDNIALSRALKTGLEAAGDVTVAGQFTRGEDSLAAASAEPPHAVLMDVQLAGELNGIQTAAALRREYPRLPVVFYSIQDDEDYYRAFLRSGILSHYAYVRKSNFLLPESILPLLREARAGGSFIDPEIEARVQAVRHKDANDPLDSARTQRTGGGRVDGPGLDQRADRRAPGLSRRARRQPHQRADLHRLGVEQLHHRRKGRPHPRGAHLPAP